MASPGFIFDFIVNKLEFNEDQQFKFSDIIIEAQFGDAILNLKSSKSDNSSFREGRSFEFNATNEVLMKMIENPVKIQVKQLENKIGELEINWDQNLIDALAGDLFSAHSQFEDKEILSDGTKIGDISIALKLHCRCKEDIFKNYVGPLADAQGNLTICNEMEQVLDPTDVLFVIGDSTGNNRNVLGQCDDSECPPRLDVSRYQIVRGKLLKTTEILKPCGNLDCCELTDFQLDYQKNIKNKNVEKHDCSTSEDSCSRGTSSILPGRLSCGDFTAVIKNKPEQNNRYNPMNCEKLNFTQKFSSPYEKNRTQICNTVMDNSKNSTLDSILKQWNTNSCAEANYSKTSLSDNKCICTCKDDKICPHCRINKVVNKLLQDIKVNKCNPFVAAKNTIVASKTISQSEQCYNVLKEYGSEESITAEVIPYLSKTLQALKAKYKFSNDDGNREEQKLDNKSKKRYKGSKANGTGIYDQNLRNIERTIECCPKDIQTQQMYFKCKQRRYMQRVKYRTKTNSKYTGVIFGHKTCKGYGSGVPKNMGWLWKNKGSSPTGWKPGAISKPIKDIMKYFLTDFPADSLLVSKCAKQEKIIDENNNPEFLTQKPTLKVVKKNGEYLITMRPLKHVKEIEISHNSYLNVKPIQFRIIKSPILIHKREIKNNLKSCGFSKCTCHLPLPRCFCRSFLEKEKLDTEVEKQCESRDIPNIKDTLVLSDTTDSESELDIEFTPPVGLFKPHLRKQSDIACKETQYNIKDFRTESISAKLNGVTGAGTGDVFAAAGGGNGGAGGRGGPGGGGAGGKGGPGGAGAGGKGGPGAGGKGGPGAGGKGGPGAGGAGGKGAGGAGGAGGKGGKGGAGGKGGGKNRNGKGGGDGGGGGKSNKPFQSQKDKYNELMSVPPPILCMVDRKGATEKNYCTCTCNNFCQ